MTSQKPLTRREVIERALRAGVVTAVLKPGYLWAVSAESTKTTKAGVLLGGLTLDKKSNTPVVNNMRQEQHYSLQVLNESNHVLSTIPVPFPPHSVLVHPTKPATILAIPNERQQSDVMEVNLELRKVTNTIKSMSGRGFYGHGLIGRLDSNLLLVEFERDDSTVISVRDSIHYKEIGRINCHGTNPHAIAHLDGLDADCVLVCCSNVANVINLKTGSLKRSYRMPDPLQKFGHIQIAPDGVYYLLGNTGGSDRTKTVGSVFRVSSRDERVQKLEYPTPVYGEALSSAVHLESMTMVVTHQDCDIVSVWDIRTDKCKTLLKLADRPRGVVVLEDDGKFIISNILGQRFELSAKAPYELKQIKTDALFVNSSHLLLTEIEF